MRDTRNSKILTYGLLALFVAMVAIPLFWMVTTAIKTNKELYEDFSYFPLRPTLENFVRVIVREELLTNIRNSFSVAMSTTVITVIVSAMAAFSIVRYRYRGRDLIGRLILFKYLLPSAMLFIPLYVIVTALGLGNTQQGLILTYLTFTIPFCTWMLMGYFHGMPVELEEQAMVDGCTKLGALVRILLPLSAPGLVASAIFSFTLAWNEFLLALVITMDQSTMTVPIKLSMMVAGDQYIWGQLMAGAVLASVPVAILYFIGQRFVVQGLAAGAVKS
ncbi:MAG TPA: carbohydrate ABC transporter permease [Candidatus Tectomicrobia bacterium]|jgi:multiple sugar transport system permease protein